MTFLPFTEPTLTQVYSRMPRHFVSDHPRLQPWARCNDSIVASNYDFRSFGLADTIELLALSFVPARSRGQHGAGIAKHYSVGADLGVMGDAFSLLVGEWRLLHVVLAGERL
jgi:hypothetical protein